MTSRLHWDSLRRELRHVYSYLYRQHLTISESLERCEDRGGQMDEKLGNTDFGFVTCVVLQSSSLSVRALPSGLLSLVLIPLPPARWTWASPSVVWTERVRSKRLVRYTHRYWCQPIYRYLYIYIHWYSICRCSLHAQRTLYIYTVSNPPCFALRVLHDIRFRNADLLTLKQVTPRPLKPADENDMLVHRCTRRRPPYRPFTARYLLCIGLRTAANFGNQRKGAPCSTRNNQPLVSLIYSV